MAEKISFYDIEHRSFDDISRKGNIPRAQLEVKVREHLRGASQAELQKYMGGLESRTHKERYDR